MKRRFQDIPSRLLDVDIAEYDHWDLPKVVIKMSKMTAFEQNNMIYDALKVYLTFDQLIEYIRQQFFLLFHEDEEGPYTALAFGNQTLSIATWDYQDVYPSDLDDTNYTDVYVEHGHFLRSEHLLRFIDFWIEYYNTTLEDFFSELEHATD
jgi:hypothetical protein